MDVQKMGMDLASAAPDEGAAPQSGGADDAKGKDAMAELSLAMKSGDHEAMWHAFQGAMACAGCDLGDGSEDSGSSEESSDEE